MSAATTDGGEGPRLALAVDADGFEQICSAYLTEYLDKILLACDGLDDRQVWSRDSEHSNSIGNLLLHLCGNLSLWIRVTLGGRAFVRDRPAEFAARETASAEELKDRLSVVVDDCHSIVAGLESSDLRARFTVQGYPVSGLGVLLHAVEHMSYHTGQIVLMAKAERDRSGEQFEFYPHLREDSKE